MTPSLWKMAPSVITVLDWASPPRPDDYVTFPRSNEDAMTLPSSPDSVVDIIHLPGAIT